MMAATHILAGGELTQVDLEASINAAHAHLSEGTPESADQARDLLEEILESCDGAQAASMVRLQCEAKYELAGILHDAGHDVEARALYLEAIDGFVQHDCLQAALNAKMGYGLLLCDADDMEAAIPLLEAAYSGHHAALGPNDPRTLRAGMNLANALADEPGRAAEAHQLLGTAVEGYTTAFGEDHTDTLDAKLCATCMYTFVCEVRTALTPTGGDPQELLHITEGSGRGAASYTPVGGGRFWEDGTNRT
jgi:hypothetical protein